MRFLGRELTGAVFVKNFSCKFPIKEILNMKKIIIAVLSIALLLAFGATAVAVANCSVT